MIINIIHLENDPKFPHREERERSVINQMESEGCSYRFWDGIICKERKVGINRAHKQIIRFAKDSKMPMVLIAEDDLRFTAKGAYNYFLSQMPEEFDLYLSSYYSGSVDENYIIKKFSGLTMYICAERYYDIFLSAPENFHLDTALSMVGGRFIVCPKFCAIQASGYSDQRNRMVDDSKRLIGKPIYNG